MSLKGGQAVEQDDKIDILNAFATGKSNVTPQMIDTVIKLIPTLTCTVTDTLNWSDLTHGESFTLEIDEAQLVKGHNYIFSTEHLVIFAYMFLSGTPETPTTPSTRRPGVYLFRKLAGKDQSNPSDSSIPPTPPKPPRRKRVIIKYHLHKNDGGDNITVKNMTQSHCEALVKNYNTIHGFLTHQHTHENRFQNIRCVGLCIAESKTKGWLRNYNFANLWIEEFVPNFTRMWHKQPKLHIHLVATTDHDDLLLLQKIFFEANQEKFTIADLQGGCKEIGPNQYEYILCDVEFTNTLQKFGKVGDPFYTNRELITIARRQWTSKGRKAYCVIS